MPAGKAIDHLCKVSNVEAAQVRLLAARQDRQIAVYALDMPLDNDKKDFT